MKKQIITIAIVLGMGSMSFAQFAESFVSEEFYEDAGLFRKSSGIYENSNDVELILPYEYEGEESFRENIYGMDNFEEAGLFGLGKTVYGPDRTMFNPRLPDFESNQDQDAPLGSGIAVLTALGAAYLVGKKRKEE